MRTCKSTACKSNFNTSSYRKGRCWFRHLPSEARCWMLPSEHVTAMPELGMSTLVSVGHRLGFTMWATLLQASCDFCRIPEDLWIGMYEMATASAGEVWDRVENDDFIRPSGKGETVVQWWALSPHSQKVAALSPMLSVWSFQVSLSLCACVDSVRVLRLLPTCTHGDLEQL